MRLILKFGSPLNVNGIRYKTNKDRMSEQDQYITNWQIMLNEYLQNLQDKYKGFKIYTYGKEYVRNQLYR